MLYLTIGVTGKLKAYKTPRDASVMQDGETVRDESHLIELLTADGSPEFLVSSTLDFPEEYTKLPSVLALVAKIRAGEFSNRKE